MAKEMTMGGATHTVRTMIAVEKAYGESRMSGVRVFPVAAGLVNLFVCAFFENPIKGSAGNEGLALFLLVQGIAFAAIVLAHMNSIGLQVLSRSAVFPTTSSQRFLFSMAIVFRHRVMAALILTDLFFLLVMFHEGFVPVMFIPLMFLVFAAGIVAAVCLGAILTARSSRSLTGLVAIGFLAVFGIISISLVLQVNSVIGIIPPVSWTSQGMIASTHGDIQKSLICGAGNLALLAALVFAGDRLS